MARVQFTDWHTVSTASPWTGAHSFHGMACTGSGGKVLLFPAGVLLFRAGVPLFRAGVLLFRGAVLLFRGADLQSWS
eukprot:2880858-Rhodomonas_salina.1